MARALVFATALAAHGLLAQTPVRGRVVNPHGDALRIPCENCHTTTSWRPIRKEPEFNHQTQTKFALRGMHQGVACRSCHVSLIFSEAGTQCATCHADLHRRQFGSNCQECHTVRGWKVAISAVQQHTNRFPLIGVHATATCDDCHHGAASGVYTGLSTQCVSCHIKDYQRAAPLNHVAANLPVTCENCHGMDRWQGARFSHAQFTGFALTGSHAQLECASCHVGGRFQGTPSDCFNCHVNDFTHAQDPNHVAAGFSHDCGTCHTTINWSNAKFDHNSLTRFSLTGAHAAVQCAQCHVGNRFTGTPMECAGCHLPDFQKATNPNHVAGGFPQDCSTCHNTVQWQGARFDHNALTKFPLTGAHATVQCTQCHLNGQFAGTSMQCIGCHRNDFTGTNNPSHVAAGFPQDCSVCHTTVQWMGAKFDHTATGFTLTGAHTAVQCAQCHAGNNFSLSSGTCINCHVNDYNTANNPSHKAAGFPQDCSFCHNTVQWMGAKFDHSSTGFTLTGAHTTVQCAQCHTNNNFSLTSATCINCHLNDYNGALNPNHRAAGFPQDCAGCHNTIQWNGATFNHASTGFRLTGAHTNLQCAQCHVNSNFALNSPACINCHLNDYNGALNPNHKAAAFPQDCAGCHTTVQWMGATFNHASTGFALTGAHTTVQCAQCHVNGNYSFTNAACINCHQNDYNGANSPNHRAAGFPQDCTLCHTTVQWMGAKFDHATTGFSLTGTHTSLQCAQCHVNNNFGLTSGACINCHLNDFNGTNNPPHKSQDCSLCHSTVNWNGAKFDHGTTGFALTGAHTSLQCAQCHANNNFGLTSGACINCHLNDYNGAMSPPHKSSGFPQDCSGCHTTTQWMGATFNHTATGFALTGTHASIQCAQCHVNNNYSLTSAACFNCHANDYNGTNNPPHKAAGFPQDCSVCHSTVNWNNAKFDHTTTGFALTGAHTSVQCGQCHVNNNFSLTSGACVNCHLNDYNGAMSPPHKASGFPQDCTGWHSTEQWMGASFNHATTGFTLTGAHTSLQCAQCHVNNNYSLTSAACINCHLNDYNGANSPPHKASGFPQDCTLCHGTTNWTSATFDHATTGFALTGTHANLQCAQCHVNNNYNLTSAACFNCHANDYNGTTNPSHKAAGFPQDCSICHSTTNWLGATFDHSKTGFSLTGAHTSLACTKCHVNNVFAGTPTDCYSCHKADYQGVTNPNHVAAAFPTTCATCHTTATWAGAVFNHTQFPIYSGTHQGKWTTCADCHTNSSNYTVFSCITCHQHVQTDTDPIHSGVKNYVYNSTSCYSCHPQGRAG